MVSLWNSADSRLKLDSDTEWRWMLSKISDRNGNSIQCSYQVDENLRQILISKIEYGGPIESPVNEINFHYSEKDDLHYGFILDDIIINNKLLDSISMKSHNVAFGSYGFHYNTTSGESL